MTDTPDRTDAEQLDDDRVTAIQVAMNLFGEAILEKPIGDQLAQRMLFLNCLLVLGVSMDEVTDAVASMFATDGQAAERARRLVERAESIRQAEARR